MIYFIFGMVIVILTFIVRTYIQKKIPIDHFTFFSLGFVYYWFVPVFVMESSLGQKIFSDVYVYYRKIPQTTLFYYFFICIILYFSYLFGMFLGKRWKVKISKKVNFSSKINSMISVPIIILLIFFSFYFRKNFFHGYTILDNINMQAKGPFVAVSLCLFSIAVLKFTSGYLKNELRDEKIIIGNLFFFMYFLFAFLILTLGGRLYFVSGILIILILRHNYVKLIRLRNIFLIILCFIGIFSLLGVIRDGEAVVSPESVMFVFFAEPVFTSYTLFSFLVYNPISLLSFPIILLSAFINLIPTFILPNKSELLIYAKDLDIKVLAPQGAMNSFVSFNINFGVLGTIFFLILMGMLMEILLKKKSILSLTIYYMLCFSIPFSFFRDDFQTSVIKNMLEFSIIIPFLFYIINQFFTQIVISQVNPTILNNKNT